MPALMKNDSHELRGPVLYDGSPEVVLALGLCVRFAWLLLLADGRLSRTAFLGVLLLVLLLLCDEPWRKMPPKSFFMAPRASAASASMVATISALLFQNDAAAGFTCTSFMSTRTGS